MADTTDYRPLTETLIDCISRKYSYLCIREPEFDRVKRELRAGVGDIRDDTRYHHFVSEVLCLFRDGHMKFENAQGERVKTYKGRSQQNFNRQVTLNYLDQFQTNGPITLGKLKGVEGIIYLGIDNFYIDNDLCFNWFNTLQKPSEQRVIVDIRANDGGSEGLEKQVVRDLLGKQGPFISRQMKGRTSETDPRALTDFIPGYITPAQESEEHRYKLSVLVGNRTFSAGELFALDLSVIPGSTLVGDVTGGGSGFPKRYLLEGPNTGIIANNLSKKPCELGSRFAVHIPSWLTYDRDFNLIQDNGIKPNIVIPSDASIVRDRDLVLEKAVEVLKS